ncbi:MAG: ArnT family glycosyltransferase [Sulfuricaulis sp.]
MTKWFPKIETTHVILFFALILGLGLRLYGIRWGLPDATHPKYSYHPDETLHLLFARMMVTGDVTGANFIYGGTFYYSILDAFFYFSARLSEFLGGFNNLANSILIGRYFSTAMAVLTILMVYQCGLVFYGRLVGLLAAIILAVTPAHILCAQRMRPDEIGAFFPILLILLSWWIFNTSEKKNLKFYVYAGVALGTAIAFRFPLALLMAAPVSAHFFTKGVDSTAKMWRSLWNRKLVIMLGASVLGYLITSPYTFMYFGKFIQGLTIQWQFQSGTFLDSIGNGPAIYQWGWSMLHEALGYPLYYLAFGGIVLALARRSRADIIILVVGVPYFILTLFADWVVVRYTLPLLPLLAILAASFVVHVVEAIPRYKSVTYTLFVVVLAWTVLADYAFLKMEAGTDVRDVASEWIQHNLPQGSSLLILRTYIQDTYFNPVIPKGYQQLIFGLQDNSDSTTLFRGHKFDYLILHELIYKNMERLGARNPDPYAWQFYESLLSSHYKLIREFKQPIRALGVDFSAWFTSQDYVITDPAIRIYGYKG